MNLDQVEEVESSATPPLCLEGVFQLHARYVAAIGCRLLGRSEDIEDFLQDVFLEAANGLHRVRDPAAVRGWLATLAVRTARRTIRKRVLRRRLFGESEESPAPRISHEATPQERYLLLRCYKILDTLSANQRLAWTLRYLEDETLPEVARMCECSLATAKRWIKKANERIQTEIGGLE